MMPLTTASAFLALFFGLGISGASADEPTTKPAVPPATAMRKAKAQVDQLYRDDLVKARDPQAKSAIGEEDPRRG